MLKFLSPVFLTPVIMLIGVSFQAKSAEILDVKVMVRMRDGVRLDTRLLLPTKSPRGASALLIRSPYLLSGSDHIVSTFDHFLEDGIGLVIQACRGTAGSEGELDALKQEFEDGRDTVKWIVSQSWSNRKVGTIGASYEGFTAAAAAVDSPEVKMVIMDGAISRAFTGWPGQRGAPMGLGYLWWLAQVRGLPDYSLDSNLMKQLTISKPIRDHDLLVFGKPIPAWRKITENFDNYSDFWRSRSLIGRLNKMCTPTLHIQAGTEWDDDPLAAYLDSSSGPCDPQNHKFILGNHSHAGVVYSPFANTLPSRVLRDYVYKYLLDRTVDLKKVPSVQYFLANAAQWGSNNSWPASNSNVEFFLSASLGGGGLTLAPPKSKTVAAYSVDPINDDPCGQNRNSQGVYFQSLPINDNLDIVGRPEVILQVAVNTPDADLFANLYSVSPSGQIFSIHRTRLRLRYRSSYEQPTMMKPNQMEEVRLEIPAVATRVPRGHRLILHIAGSDCGTPQNSNTGARIDNDLGSQISRVQIFTGPVRQSVLRLPVHR